MKILQVVDSPWAIGALAKAIKEENAHHSIEILTIHPKDYRENKEHFNRVFIEKVKSFSPEVIHFHYWDTAFYLSQLEITEGIYKILTHHNQKNLLTHKWDKIDCLVTHTQKAKNILQESGYWNVKVIQHGIDIEHFIYNENYQREKLFGYVGRIVPWKGLYDILKVANSVEAEVIMMGKIDKADYWKKCREFENVMDIRFGTPYEEQPKVYSEMSVYIGNSCDGIEEGTLGLLEAMACGVPVITTPSGEAQDIIVDGVNGIIIDFEDIESLTYGLRKFYSMTEKQVNEMRENAWNTVRVMNRQKMALEYEKLYYSIREKSLVSVIIPTSKRAETIEKVVLAYDQQSYANIEIIVVVDDTSIKDYEGAILRLSKLTQNAVKWICTGYNGYGLAQARNRGIFEAVGNYLVFSDDRFIPDVMAVEVFVRNLSKKKEFSAVWGDKGAGKRDFIENFFCIRKKHICLAGMFNERIDEYGGQSQEIRERLRRLEFNLHYEPMAKAKAQFGTKNKTKRRYELFRMKSKLEKLKYEN